MRIKYYLLTLRQMNIKKSFVLFVVLVIFTLIISICVINNSIKPTIKELCRENSKSMALQTTNKAVSESIDGITYEDLITIKQDNNGRINALVANVSLMNKISNSVTTLTEKQFSEYEKKYINIPSSSFFGINFFAGHGIKVKINTILTGSVKAEFKSTFEDAGINQTKHKVYIDITTTIKSVAPLILDEEEYVNTIMIAETVLVGDIPATYYNIEGVEDFSQKDTLEMME